MKIFVIQIGNMSGQYNYRIKANNSKRAKELAVKRHAELGRSKTADRVYVLLAY